MGSFEIENYPFKTGEKQKKALSETGPFLFLLFFPLAKLIFFRLTESRHTIHGCAA